VRVDISEWADATSFSTATRAAVATPWSCATIIAVSTAACTKTAQCARRTSSIQPPSAACSVADTLCTAIVSARWFVTPLPLSNVRVRAARRLTVGVGQKKIGWGQVNQSHLARCPLCAVSITESAAAWAQLDSKIAQSPMPEEYRNKQVSVLCNDCHATNSTAFHVLGLKCIPCGSYNTRKI